MKIFVSDEWQHIQDFHKKYPIHRSYFYKNDRPVLKVTIDSLLDLEFLIDTGAHCITMPFEPFKGHGYFLDETKPQKIKTGKIGEEFTVWPVVNSFGDKVSIKLGGFSFDCPVTILSCEELRSCVIGRQLISKGFAFLFEHTQFHIFARDNGSDGK